MAGTLPAQESSIGALVARSSWAETAPMGGSVKTARITRKFVWHHLFAMTLITATFVTDPKLVLRSYRASHRGAYVLRCVASVALVVSGIVTLSIGTAALGVVLFGVSEFLVRRELSPYLGGQRNVTVTMSDDEYRTQGPDRATSRTWSTFSGVRRVGAFWVLRISTAAAMALPISALDPDQTREFEELLRRKGLLRR